ncbi:hypothetical protein MHB42_09805 [Lysinibacillus sp. FSL K6-0232]|uniref:hypothetical protein n=1 Tax=Lysinibacillus sp. FSL K6-0232 TaxID=2921425 RepID=UPI0030FB56F3
MNDNNGTIMALLTLVYVGATILILKANKDMVKESVKLREAESRPYVIAYLEERSTGSVFLTIENIGKSIADNVKISSNRKIEYPEFYHISDSYIFRNPFMLAPNQKIDFFIHQTTSGSVKVKKDSNGLYPIYLLNISYESDNNRYEEKNVIDLNIVKHRVYEENKDRIKYIVEELKDIKVLLKNKT